MAEPRSRGPGPRPRHDRGEGRRGRARRPAARPRARRLRTDIGPGGRAEQDPRDWWAALSVGRAVDRHRRRRRPWRSAASARGPRWWRSTTRARPCARRSPGRTGGRARAGSGCCRRMAWLAHEDPAAAVARDVAPAGLGRAGAVAHRRGGHVAPGPRDAAHRRRARGRRGARRPGASRAAVRDDARRAPARGGSGARAAGRDARRGGRERRDGEHAGRRAAGRWRRGRHRWHVGRNRDLRGPTDLGARACSAHPPRCRDDGSWAGPWPRSAPRSTGCARRCWATAGRSRSCSRRQRPCRPGRTGCVFLPYLAGERAPVFDEGARGAFVGLTLAHGRGHLVRAVLEGAAFAVRDVAEPLAAAGAPVTELRLAGRPTPGRPVGPDQGRRARRAGHRARGRRDGGPRRGDPRGRGGRGGA